MEWASGNIFIRPNTLAKAGDQVQGHAHAFDHTTIAFKGSIRVRRTRTDGAVDTVDLVAPAHCLIVAGVEHEITALEDDTVFWCVYSHREPQGDIVQDVTGWAEAYQ
jgi:quercetin dioxygenase-like cupin family protein